MFSNRAPYDSDLLRYGQPCQPHQHHAAVAQALTKYQLAEVCIGCKEHGLAGISVCQNFTIRSARRRFRDVNHLVAQPAKLLDDGFIEPFVRDKIHGS